MCGMRFVAIPDTVAFVGKHAAMKFLLYSLKNRAKNVFGVVLLVLDIVFVIDGMSKFLMFSSVTSDMDKSVFLFKTNFFFSSGGV